MAADATLGRCSAWSAKTVYRARGVSANRRPPRAPDGQSERPTAAAALDRPVQSIHRLRAATAADAPPDVARCLTPVAAAAEGPVATLPTMSGRAVTQVGSVTPGGGHRRSEVSRSPERPLEVSADSSSCPAGVTDGRFGEYTEVSKRVY